FRTLVLSRSALFGCACFSSFSFTDPAPPEIYTLSLHDALPISVEPVQLTSGIAEHTAPVFTADGSAVLAVREDYESEHRDLRTALVSLPTTGGTARTLLSAADGFRIARAAVAGDGTVAMLASRPAQRRASVAPDVALWLLEAAGPPRLTDPETLDLASSGADLEVIGPDFLVRRL